MASAALTTPTTAHPPLRSSRRRPLLQDQVAAAGHVTTPTPMDAPTPQTISDSNPDSTQKPLVAHRRAPLPLPRQRKFSDASVETIRVRAKPKLAIAALLKPRPTLDTPSLSLSISRRKRTRSDTVDDGLTSASPTSSRREREGAAPPRVRQRTDSLSASTTTSLSSDTTAARMATTTTTLGKLKERLQQGADDAKNLVAFPSEDTRAPTPLQSLSLNTEPVSLSTFARKPLRIIPGARINKYGCYEPDIDEFELAVAFPSDSGAEFEVWDQENELFFVGPISLHLTLKDPVKWAGLPLSHPDVSVLEITCTSKPVLSTPNASPSVPTPTPNPAAASTLYTTTYTGAKTHTPGGTPLPADPTRGIAIDPVWLRTYPDTDPHTGRVVGRRGWAMAFGVPLATRLFERCETRAFEVRARVRVGGGGQGQGGGEVEAAVGRMCVSHLRRERDMPVVGHMHKGVQRKGGVA
ncbi:hypothetical protein MKEN_00200900 [Mycena kentingensis (nom. inval.)]|nr:hypothetical protein MKEN_00200900 [Mycena kentingensis (nom. inval.)]